MSTESRGGERPTLPLVLIADGGRTPVRLPLGLSVGILLRDIDLVAVLERVANRASPVVLDLDSVRGLDADGAAVDFVLDTLGIDIILSRRTHVAARVAARGGLGLLHAPAFDSTGVARSLSMAPMVPGIGIVLSPGSVLCHMQPAERAALRRPVVGYGLLTTVEGAIACLEHADAVAVRQDVAEALGAVARRASEKSLTAAVAEE